MCRPAMSTQTKVNIKINVHGKVEGMGGIDIYIFIYNKKGREGQMELKRTPFPPPLQFSSSLPVLWMLQSLNKFFQGVP